MHIRTTPGFWLILLFGAVFILPVSAQLSPERTALNNLEKGKFNRARSQLEKLITRDSLNPIAHFLMSRFFFSPENPGFNIDSAYHYCNTALAQLAVVSGKSRERLVRFALDSTVIISMRKKIDSAAFQRAKSLNTEAAYQFFIDRFAQAAQVSQAIELRDEVAFLQALMENTYLSYRRFLDKYPQSHRAAEAQARYDKLLFETKTSDQKLASFERFIMEYPASPYRTQAERQVFEISTAVCTPSALLRFIAAYPQSKYRKEAVDLLYHLLKENEEPFPAHLLIDSLRQIKALESEHLLPYFKEGRFGWMNTGGKEIIAPVAEYIDEEYRCSYAMEDVLFGGEKLIARNNRILATEVISYQDLEYGFLLVKTENCGYVLHKSGRRITGCVKDAQVVGQSLLAVQKEDSWQLLSFTGKILISEAQGFIDLHPVIGIKQSRHIELMLLSDIQRLADGDPPLTKVTAEEVRKLPAGIWIRNKGRQALLDQTLRELIPAAEQEISPVFFGALVSSVTGYRLHEKDLANMPAGEAIKIQEPWITIKQQGVWKAYYKTLRTPLNRLFDSLSFAGPALITITGDSLKVYLKPDKIIQLAGKPQIRFLPGKDSLYYLRVDLPNARTIFDSNGQRLFVTDAESIAYAGENFFEGTKNNKKGLISSSGKWVIPPEYDALGTVQQGMVSVLRNNKFGIWNLNIRKEIKPEYDRNIMPLNANLLIAVKQYGTGIIGWDNKPVIPFQYDEILPWTDTLLLVRKNFQWMLIDRITQKIQVDRIQSFNWIKRTAREKLVLFNSEGYYGILSNLHGMILQPTYTFIHNMGTESEPFYITEKHIEEAGIYVLIYYDASGKLVRRQVLEEDEYEKMRCIR